MAFILYIVFVFCVKHCSSNLTFRCLHFENLTTSIKFSVQIVIQNNAVINDFCAE